MAIQNGQGTHRGHTAQEGACHTLDGGSSAPGPARQALPQLEKIALFTREGEHWEVKPKVWTGARRDLK